MKKNNGKRKGIEINGKSVNVERDIVGGDITYHIVNVYNSVPGESRLSPEEFKGALARYLNWVIESNGSIIFRGIQREQGYSLKLPLSQLYVPLEGEEIIFNASSQSSQSHGFYESLEKLREALNYGSSFVKKNYSLLRGDYQSFDFSKILNRTNRLAITGEPGSGKSVLLQYIAWLLSTCLINNTPDQADSKLGLSGPIPLPILIPLNSYAKHIQEHNNAQDPKLRTLPTFISYYLIQRHAALGLPNDFFERILSNGDSVILLLDGLDEIPTEDERLMVASAIQDLSNNLPDARILVTARLSVYKGNIILPTNYREIRMKAVDNQIISSMVNRFYDAIYPNDQDEVKRLSDDLLLSLRHLEQQRQISGRQNPLISSPLLVRMSIIVHFNQRVLPSQRAGLYKESVDSMLMPVYHPDAEVAIRLSRQVSSLPDQRAIYSALAYFMHSKGEIKGRLISEFELRNVIHEILKNRYSRGKIQEIQDEFLIYAKDRGGLLDEKFRSFQFVHLGFQEYLAAVYIAENERLPDKMVDYYESINAIIDPWWREPILLTAGYLALTNPNVAYDFIVNLADFQNNRNRSVEQHLVALELAGTAYLEWQGEGIIREQLASAINEILFDQNASSLNPSLRASAGRVYVQLNESRSDVLQDIPELINIPSTELDMGYFDENFQFVNLPSLREGTHRISVKNYLIGKYPVTNRQFTKFIASKGYSDQNYWTTEGWKWKQEQKITKPAYWDDIRWNISSTPVVGVSWYEANAYCNWLSIATKSNFRLPTEAEWELAARGNDGRLWPWGNNFEERFANTLESGIGETNIVGLFTEGKSPFGLLDCAGNIWEWCNSIYLGYPFSSTDGRESINGYEPRCHRGGSWLNSLEYAICANRDRYFPGDRHYDLGFRVCCEASLSNKI